jgi:hypothetical protein
MNDKKLKALACLEHLLNVIGKLRADPTRNIVMDYFYSEFTEHGTKSRDTMQAGTEPGELREYLDEHRCGTAACLAGYAVLIEPCPRLQSPEFPDHDASSWSHGLAHLIAEIVPDYKYEVGHYLYWVRLFAPSAEHEATRDTLLDYLEGAVKRTIDEVRAA